LKVTRMYIRSSIDGMNIHKLYAKCDAKIRRDVTFTQDIRNYINWASLTSTAFLLVYQVGLVNQKEPNR
jgi:hypothetical protein